MKTLRIIFLLFISLLLCTISFTGCKKKEPEIVPVIPEDFFLNFEETETETPLRWIALGDSITCGYYSKEDGSYSKSLDVSWTSHVASELNLTVNNQGHGGIGFVDTSGDKSTNGRTLVDTIDFSNYDFATIALGVNDWKGYCKVGNFNDDISMDATVYSNMRYMVEKILSDNPECKIIVISPINCWAYGTYETHYGIGHKFNSTKASLADVFNAEKEVCEYYNLHFIDMLYDTFINRDNIQDYLLDKVHPSIECHKLLGQELAAKIQACLKQ